VPILKVLTPAVVDLGIEYMRMAERVWMLMNVKTTMEDVTPSV
jgi:hypothetical protein